MFQQEQNILSFTSTTLLDQRFLQSKRLKIFDETKVNAMQDHFSFP
jgi:hypothetical protein